MASVPNDQSIDQNILLKYAVVAKMGSGAYGHVWKVTDKSNQQTYALKKVYSAFQNQLDAQRTYRQISILKKVKHGNIVKLCKVLRAQNDFDLYLVFEFIQSDLFKAVKGNILEQSHKKYIIYQIAKSLKYIHSAGIIHRDIKPSNILIDTDCKIKICDFGLSRTTFSSSSAEPVITQFIATRWYRAPQVMLGSKSYGYKSDIWSFACLIYEMYAYKALLPGKDNIDQIQKLLELKGFPNEQQKKSLKVEGVDKILGHFTTQKKDSDHYFGKIEDKKLKKLLTKMFEYDPSKRPTAEEILQHPFLEQLKMYQQQPVAEAHIQLEQNQQNKLSSAEYRQLIYDMFAQKDSLVVEKSLKSVKAVQNQKNNHKAIVERTLKKKSSHLIKNNSSLILDTNLKLPHDEKSKLPSEEKLKLPSHQQKNKQLSQQKRRQVSLVEISCKKIIVPQGITEPLYLEDKNSLLIKQKIDKYKNGGHDRNTSIVMLQKVVDRSKVEMGQRQQQQESGLIHKNTQKKKRTVKYNSLHHQPNPTLQSSLQHTQLQNHHIKHSQFKKSHYKHSHKHSQHSHKHKSPQSPTPYQSRPSLSKNTPKSKLSSISPHNTHLPTKSNQISIHKSATTPNSPIKNSLSIQSTLNSTAICDKDKLPLLIIKQKPKHATNLKDRAQIQKIEKKIFNDITNVRKSEEQEVKLKREHSFMEIKTKKLQKKGIYQLHNKDN